MNTDQNMGINKIMMTFIQRLKSGRDHKDPQHISEEWREKIYIYDTHDSRVNCREDPL